jgi:hypothetical protein
MIFLTLLSNNSFAASTLYRITSGTFDVFGTIAGHTVENLPASDQSFIELRLDSRADRAEMRILDDALGPFRAYGYGSAFVNGIVAGNEIRFLDTMFETDFQTGGTLTYVVTLAGDTLSLDGSLKFPPRCCDISGEFYHSKIQALRVTEPRVGDFNQDGKLDVTDIDLLVAEIQAGKHRASFDLGGDGIVDDADLTTWIRIIKQTWFGDINLDGEFNSGDLVNVFQAGEYEDSVRANSNWATGDWNADREFTSADLVMAFQDGGYERGPRMAVVLVPEPSHAMSWSCLVIGAVVRVSRRVAALRK